LFRNPWFGVILSVSLMCAAVCWALQALLPPFWALAGGVLVAARWGVFGYWMNSYWGGAPAALGGALVLGAVPRILRRGRVSDSILLGVGMAVLANSRPYEGFFLCIPVAIVLLAWILGANKFCRWFGFRSSRPPLGTLARQVILPLVGTLALTALLMGYYCWRVTGDPLTMPRVLEARQYSITPLFLWQNLRPAPTYNDERFRYFFTQFEPNDSSESTRAFLYWVSYLGPALSIPLLVMPGLMRSGRTRFLLLATGAIVAGLSVEWWARIHYAAPAVAAIYGLVLEGCRYLRYAARRSRWQDAGSVVAMAVLVGFLTSATSAITKSTARPSSSSSSSMQRRAELERKLTRDGEKHLVLVRYTDHNREPNIHNEWVYNVADIDHAPVVWARELDPEHNRELLQYFKGRRVWMVDPDHGELTPLP
jgi:hypothetical protein